MGVAGGAGALFDLDVVFLEVFLELLLVVLVCVDGLSVVLQDGGVVAQLCRADGGVLDAEVEGETHDVDLCGVVFLQVLVELSLVPLPGVVEGTVVLAIGQVPFVDDLDVLRVDQLEDVWCQLGTSGVLDTVHWP